MADLREDRYRRPKNLPASADRKRLWPTYLGISGLLLLILVALAGGIIWYNSKKSKELAVADAQRLMEEAEGKIIERIKLLYDPMYAIVGIASMVPQLTSPSVGEDPHAIAMLLRALRFYPQIQSLYVGFENGDLDLVTHIAGKRSAALRASLKAPSEAVFAAERITTGADGKRWEYWSFLAEDGAVVERRPPVPARLDPRLRPWYEAAKRSDVVAQSGLYVFFSSGQPGFTLSRRFGGPTPGVMGADLATIDLADFLRSQKITASSTAFIFTGSGEVVASPGSSLQSAASSPAGARTATLPKIADLHDPVIIGLAAAYRNGQMTGTRVYDVEGRSYIGRIVAIPPRYGRDQLLAIVVPIDEIEKPIEAIRNETLLYSIAFLVFALPLYVTLVVAWIDRRLGSRPATWPQFRDDE
jgi:adenylate cyclase